MARPLRFEYAGSVYYDTPTHSGGHAYLIGNLEFMRDDGFATLRARHFAPVHPLRVFPATSPRIQVC